MFMIICVVQKDTKEDLDRSQTASPIFSEWTFIFISKLCMQIQISKKKNFLCYDLAKIIVISNFKSQA